MVFDSFFPIKTIFAEIWHKTQNQKLFAFVKDFKT